MIDQISTGPLYIFVCLFLFFFYQYYYFGNFGESVVKQVKLVEAFISYRINIRFTFVLKAEWTF